MKDDDITREQMNDFCERARAAVAADRAVLVTSVHGLTNLCAAVHDENDQDQDEVMADLIADLARAIVSMNTELSVTLRNAEGKEILFNTEGTHMRVRQKVLEGFGNDVG